MSMSHFQIEPNYSAGYRQDRSCSPSDITSANGQHQLPPSRIPVPPKRKRGRPPKKTPIDTQMMVTTPQVSMGSSMPAKLSQSAYSFQFDSNTGAAATPHIRRKRKSVAAASASASNNSPSSDTPRSGISSSPPSHDSVQQSPQVYGDYNAGDYANTTSSAQQAPSMDNALGISFGNNSAQPMTLSLSDCQVVNQQQYEQINHQHPVDPLQHTSHPLSPHTRDHVDPSLIFHGSLNNSMHTAASGAEEMASINSVVGMNPLSVITKLAPPAETHMHAFSSPGHPNLSMLSPVTPKTFTSMVSSSPMYAGYFATPGTMSLVDSHHHHHHHAPSSVSSVPNSSMLPSGVAPGSVATAPTMELTHDDSSVSPKSGTPGASPQRQSAPQLRRSATTSSLLSSPFHTSSNACTRKAICERRNSGANLTLPRSHSMRRLTAAAPYSNGPLSAPIRSTTMARSHSLKRRISLNITRGRAAVVENNDDEMVGQEQDPMLLGRKLSMHTLGTTPTTVLSGAAMARTQTEPSITANSGSASSHIMNISIASASNPIDTSAYKHGPQFNRGYVTQRRHTIYDRSIDYINDNARRMSLESLFPELSPATTQQQAMTFSPPMNDAFTVGQLKDFDVLNIEDSDGDEQIAMASRGGAEDDEEDDEENTENQQPKNDARDALKRALERNNSTKSLDQQVYSMDNYNTIPQYPDLALPIY